MVHLYNLRKKRGCGQQQYKRTEVDGIASMGLDVVDHGEDARLVDGRRELVRVQSIEADAFKHSWNSLVRLNRPFVEADENAFEVQNVFTVL